jgi:hypothetical protein
LHRPYSATAAAIRLDGFSYTDTLKGRIENEILTHARELLA